MAEERYSAREIEQALSAQEDYHLLREISPEVADIVEGVITTVLNVSDDVALSTVRGIEGIMGRDREEPLEALSQQALRTGLAQDLVNIEWLSMAADGLPIRVNPQTSDRNPGSLPIAHSVIAGTVAALYPPTS